jgi:hypothetical protein
VLAQILGRNIVHRDLSGSDFSDVWICRVLHCVDNFGLESLTFFDQLPNDLGICFPDTGHTDAVNCRRDAQSRSPGLRYPTLKLSEDTEDSRVDALLEGATRSSAAFLPCSALEM